MTIRTSIQTSTQIDLKIMYITVKSCTLIDLNENTQTPSQAHQKKKITVLSDNSIWCVVVSQDLGVWGE